MRKLMIDRLNHIRLETDGFSNHPKWHTMNIVSIDDFNNEQKVNVRVATFHKMSDEDLLLNFERIVSRNKAQM